METLEAKVVKSLDGEIGLFPFIPYLLQDLWEIGAAPGVISGMIKEHLGENRIKVLDLGCGKGAVSVRLAAETGCYVKGIDAVKEFIEFAGVKAKEYGVADICCFEVGDIREAVNVETGYDLVILGACGDVLGNFDATIKELTKVITDKGWMIIDDAFCEEGQTCDGYLTHPEILDIFRRNKIQLIREERATGQKDVNDFNTHCISQRAEELTKQFPDQRELFEAYVRKQVAESHLIENDIQCVTWLLRKNE